MTATTSMRTRNNFLYDLEQRFSFMQRYEDKNLQQKALAILPLLLFEQRAQERMRSLQNAVKKGELEDLNVSIQEMLILELLAWFKENFEWVNSPDCDFCGEETSFSHMSYDPVLLAHANRIEMHRCKNCSKFTPFYRYTNLNILLETREGRCGEWASIFTLFCRSMGWDTRYVHDETDHVWTEVYSIAQKRWLHCDPCENVCDNPLIYESGWGKKLSYIIAFSHEEIQDVTWRYTSNHKQTLGNRKFCTELELIDTMIQLRENRQRNLSEARRKYLDKRLIEELIELMVEKNPNDTEMQGRTSGSLAWRMERGETGANLSNDYVWIPSDNDINSNQITIKYSPSTDTYIKLNSNNDIVDKIEKWENGVNFCKGIFKKIEKDWKMVYFCRKEGIAEGQIHWKFDLNNTSKVIDKVTVILQRKTFENGEIFIQLCGDNKCIPLTTEELTTQEFCGNSTLIIKSILKGGRGDCAWQHAQLFRQSINDKNYPFHVIITFKNK